MTAISSPCIQVCKVEAGRCIGCGRTLHQIARWSRMTESERQRIMRDLKARRGNGDAKA